MGVPSRVDEDDRVDRPLGPIYTRARDDVFRTALRYGAGDRDFAEDVTQDVFVRLMGALGRLDDRDELGGWLYRVTVNLCLNRLQRERARRTLLGLLGRGLPSTVVPERVSEARSELARVLETIEALPPKERVALTMLHVDGRSQNEIAEVLGHSKGYVSKLVDRAHARVRARGWEVRDA